jgi:hypothetical protein
MSVAVVELIALELLDRLETLIDNDGAYNTDVSEVIRPTRFGTWTPQDMQIVLTQGPNEIVAIYPGNPAIIERTQTFNIRCHVMSDERGIEAIDTVVNTFAADVIKVVCTETEWHTFDGNAINAEWLSQEDVQADGGVDGVNVPIAITYRTDETDPYVVRS